uniref:Uncharacterized protein n=1 Tax=Lotus japonicus TaxID=34305 RepID=I3S4V3_LOTJA|nr:unknown [Lotus japonicus]
MQSMVIAMSIRITAGSHHFKHKILCAHWTLMRLAFLQPKPDNIMLILTFATWASNYPSVKVRPNNSRCFLCPERTFWMVYLKNIPSLKVSLNLLTLVASSDWDDILNRLLDRTS